MSIIPEKAYKKLIKYCQYGNLKEICRLLEEYPDMNINHEDEYGYTALSSAIFYNRKNVVIFLLKRDDIDINKYNPDNITPLMQVCCIGMNEDHRKKLLTLFLERKDIDINKIGQNGFTALIVTCYCDWNNKECVELLLNYPNINVNIKDDIGYTALMHACDWNNIEIVEILIQHGADYDMFVE